MSYLKGEYRMGICGNEDEYNWELEEELDREFDRQAALDEYLYDQYLREEEERKEREGLFPGVTLNGHGIHDRDIPYYNDDNSNNDDAEVEDNKYAEYEDLSQFERIR